jgi:hypothetical protein
MPATMTSSYNQVIDIINKLDKNEKAKLAQYLNNITLSEWLNDFREQMKDIPITFDEITELVEEVRQERYDSCH